MHAEGIKLDHDEQLEILELTCNIGIYWGKNLLHAQISSKSQHFTMLNGAPNGVPTDLTLS